MSQSLVSRPRSVGIPDARDKSRLGVSTQLPAVEKRGVFGVVGCEVARAKAQATVFVGGVIPARPPFAHTNRVAVAVLLIPDLVLGVEHSACSGRVFDCRGKTQKSAEKRSVVGGTVF